MTNPQCIHIPDGSVVISGEVFDHFCGFAKLQNHYDEHIAQLRGNLSLAEEGLASATQEIEQLRAERHMLRNELTAARLDGERLSNIVTGCPVCSELERNIKPADEPGASRTVDEIDAPFARRINAEFRRYSAMPPIEFVDLAYDTLSDAAGTEHTTMIHELCARACPEWARDLSETAKVDPPANAPQCPLPVACGRCGGVLGHEAWCNGLSQKSGGGQ